MSKLTIQNITFCVFKTMSDKICLWDGQIFTLLPSCFKGELLKNTFGLQIKFHFNLL